jgi:hypothetical protein
MLSKGPQAGFRQAFPLANKEVTVTYEQRTPEQMRELAEKVVRLILEDEGLIEELGDRLMVLGKQKCPKAKHNCVSPFECKRPFTCPKVHTVSKPPAELE